MIRTRNLCFIIVAVLCISSVFAQEIKTSVNDYANIISDSEEQQIAAISKEMYDANVAQYAVVTIDTLNGKDIESYSFNLANGHLGDPQKNNGLLLLVAVNDHKYRFEVGKGLEGDLNDAKVGRIGRIYLVDNFRNGDYGKGILQASEAIRDILLNGKSIDEVAPEKQGVTGFSILAILIGIIAIILLFVFGTMFDIAFRISIFTLLIGYFIFGFWFLVFALPLVFILFIVLAIMYFRKRTKYFRAAKGATRMFGGTTGLGGFKGGSGGFGGGGFGGGGASGGW